MIYIDYHDRRPIYEQIAAKISDLVRLGIFKPDQQLPSVRALAGEISINPNTIQKAYQELERQGIIYSIKGKGNFVCSDIAAIRQSRCVQIYQDIGHSCAELIRLGEDLDSINAQINLIVQQIKSS